MRQKKELSRKELRKAKRVEKKHNKKQFFQNKSHSKNSHSFQKPSTKKNKIHKNKQRVQQTFQQQVEDNFIEPQQNFQITPQEDIEQQNIKQLQEKLGINKKGKKGYEKLAKNMGFDDDLFDFLDSISNKVKDKNMDLSQYYRKREQIKNKKKAIKQKKLKKQQQQMEPQQQQEQMINTEPIQSKKQKKKRKQQKNQKIPGQQIQVKQTKTQQAKPVIEDNIEIRKSMNSLFNKLSDGNLAITFSNFMKIFQSYPKSQSIPIFSQLFIKFNLMIDKPIYHVFATNIALQAALHQTIGNRLLGNVLYNATIKFQQFYNEQQNQQEIQFIGYSKLFEKKKNYIMMVCLLYDFGSITGDYIKELVQKLSKTIDQNNIQLLSIIVNKVGSRLRNNDASALKVIIDDLKQSLQKYKANQTQQNSKIKFIEQQLNDIRFNKKKQYFLDQRMAFLHTFLKKNVVEQYLGGIKEKSILILGYEQLKNSDTNLYNWWEGEGNADYIESNQEQQEEHSKFLKKNNQLASLCKKLHFVTENRKTVFFILMQAQDYVQATQTILSSKIKNFQDNATVILKTCMSEETFNPYYPLVAAKLCSLIPKLRLNFQYAVWDQLKQIQSFQLRQITNFAKFLGCLIAQQMGNCSLSMLRFYPDLCNLQQHASIWLKLFWKNFFKKVKKQYLMKLVQKLLEPNNKAVKDNLRQYMGDYVLQNSSDQMAKLFRKLLLLGKNQEERRLLD